MLSLAEKIILTFLVISTVVVFFIPVIKKIIILSRCRPEDRGNSFLRRFFYAFFRVFFQLCTLRDERVLTGLAHVLIFYGALAFDTMTVNHILEGYVKGFFIFGDTFFARLFSASVDLFVLTVLAGVLFFAVKRFILKPTAYNTSEGDSAIIYSLITLATLTYLYYETVLVALHPGEARWAWLSKFLVSRLGMFAATVPALELHLKISYWLHTVVVFSFIAYVPHSKYFHLFAGPFNLFFRRLGPTATVRTINLETAENFGVEKVTDFTWKDALDAFSCVECGRCQDVCPAFQSGKKLSPKMVIYNLERHLLSSYRAIKRRKTEELQPLVPEVFSEEEVWACTTCGACLHVCPFAIEHPSKLLDLRQNLVLAQGRPPAELRGFFHQLESQHNPWGFSRGSRLEWAKGLNVRTAAEVSQAEYLLWVGCFGSYDERGRNIARSMVRVLQAAGVDFVVLGNEEKCCGDSARRLGNEYLFQNLAHDNLKALARAGARNIITICPHGYNTLKNEYPELLDLFSDFEEHEISLIKSWKVISHLEFLEELVRTGRLKLKKLDYPAWTYHDACYYGRHNQIFEVPRRLASAVINGQHREMKNSREHSLCCGGGGGLMWLEEKPGQRVNHLRAAEIIKTGSQLLLTSCPFCLTMLQDGLKDKGQENTPVLDVVELLASALVENEGNQARPG
ncbi:MAG: heterodisulfide reductase-related iron-sulfur binding cluster [Candidatus Saccharicenans sp.]